MFPARKDHKTLSFSPLKIVAGHPVEYSTTDYLLFFQYYTNSSSYQERITKKRKGRGKRDNVPCQKGSQVVHTVDHIKDSKLSHAVRISY